MQKPSRYLTPPTQSHCTHPHMVMETSRVDFEDLLPTMAEKLGGQALMEELCNGFRLLMDPEEGLITLESLKKNAPKMGLQGMGEEELKAMLRVGDLDGDGALDQMEFCVLMFRLSPELMEESQKVVVEALMEVEHFMA